MQVDIHDFGQGGKKIVLVGQLDIAGAQQIDLPMATVSGQRCDIVVDMGGVDFIASIGIRHLVMAAKAVNRASRKLVLLNPNPLVAEVLLTSNLDEIMPIVRSEDEARAVLATP